MTTSSVAERSEAAGTPPARRKNSGPLALLKEVVLIVVSALVLSFLIKTFLIQPFYIPSRSMEDTLTVGDRVMVSRLAPGPVDLRRGDIVVFEDPGGWLGSNLIQSQGTFGDALNTALTTVGLLPANSGEHLIKRLIGMPGDRVVCDEACAGEGGPISVNGVKIDGSSYIEQGSTPSGGRKFDVTVPDDMLFVMGDNRQRSADSRLNTDKPGKGFVPMDKVVGPAFAIVWPLERMEWLENPEEVFADVPAAGKS